MSSSTLGDITDFGEPLEDPLPRREDFCLDTVFCFDGVFCKVSEGTPAVAAPLETELSDVMRFNSSERYDSLDRDCSSASLREWMTSAFGPLSASPG